jgi:Ca2+-binding EF-hand superfamily protein
MSEGAFDTDTIEKVSIAFAKYDPDSSGSITLSDVTQIFLETLNHCVSEHDLFSLLSEVEASSHPDEEIVQNTRPRSVTAEYDRVDFSTFLQILDVFMKQNDEGENEEDLVCVVHYQS